jgi:foldase protein PrsA
VPSLAQIATCAAALLAVVSLASCGGDSSPNQIVARVGGETITTAKLGHWITVLKGGTQLAGSPARQELALRQPALHLLIALQWLVGEAADRGISISRLEVRQQIDRTERTTFYGGVAELRKFLQATGQSVSDVELQARAELAAAKLRRLAIDSAPKVTAAQVSAYYTQHKRRFLISERREARFTNTKTKAAAEKVKREVEAGKSLTGPAQRRMGELFTGARVPPSSPNNEYERAIDSATPHVVSGPYRIGADYWLYEVVRILPARQQTLAEVGDSIRRQLTSESRSQALAGFVKAWTAAWSAKTDCRAGYVVQKCRQYRGPEAADDPFRLQ